MAREQSGRGRSNSSRKTKQAGAPTMAQATSDAGHIKAAGQVDAATRGARQLLKIPGLTPDQQSYVDKAHVTVGCYDPNAIICGSKKD